VSQSPYLDEESISDDSGQLLQFWSYDTSSDRLSFLGIAQNQKEDPAYAYMGPYAAEGYSESGSYWVLANENDAEGKSYFKA
jgi:hypothetical protein